MKIQKANTVIAKNILMIKYVNNVWDVLITMILMIWIAIVVLRQEIKIPKFANVKKTQIMKFVIVQQRTN
jgi:hypothetical protein